MGFKRGFYFIIVLLFQLCNKSIAQSFKESEHWASYKNFLYYQGKENEDSALLCLKNSSTKAVEDSSWNMYLWYKNEESRYLFINNKPQLALESIQEGMLKYKINNKDTLKNFTYGWSFGGIGFIYYSWGKNEIALKYFKLKTDHLEKLCLKYPEIYSKKKRNIDKELVNVYLTQATCFQTIYEKSLNQEFYYSAIENAEKAWKYCKEKDLEYLYSKSIKAYGRLLSVLFPVEGIEFLEACKDYINKNDLVPYYISIANYFVLNKKYDKALLNLEKAKHSTYNTEEKLTSNTLNAGGETNSSLENHISAVYLEMGDIDRAIENYNTIIKSSSKDKHKEYFEAYMGLSQAYEAKDLLSKADSLAQIAQEKLRPDDKISYLNLLLHQCNISFKMGDEGKRQKKLVEAELLLSQIINDSESNYSNTSLISNFNFEMGRTYAQSYLKNERFDDYKKSVNFFYKGFRKSNELSYRIIDKSSLAYLSMNVEKFLPDFVAINYDMFTKTSSQKYINLIIDALGNNKSRTLSTLMRRSAGESIIVNKDSLSTSIIHFENEINKLESELLTEKIDSIKRDIRYQKTHLSIQLFNAKIQQEKKEDFKNPEYAKTIGSKIKAKLQENKVFVEYYLTDTLLYSIVITNSEYFIHQEKIPLNFKEIVIRKKKSVKTGQSYSDSDKILSDILLEPIKEILQNKDQICIIPDSYLYEIPFETLLYNGELLINSINVSYSYSSLLFSLNTVSGNFKNYSSLIVAPEFGNGSVNIEKDKIYRDLESDTSIFRNGNFVNLPFAKEEAISINNLFKDYGYKSNLLIKDKATKSNYIEQVNFYSISHLSTHGYGSSKDPFKSCVFFTREKESKNYILLNELYSISLNSDLVVLSGCKTGSGQIMEGEGMLALPAGFIYAGVPNVIASLWKVHDRKTKELMVAFYTHLLHDKVSYIEALRLAKLDCIEKGFLPFDWAGFILIGQ